MTPERFLLLFLINHWLSQLIQMGQRKTPLSVDLLFFSLKIRVDKPGWVDVCLKVSGQGSLVFDTIQILPVTTKP